MLFLSDIAAHVTAQLHTTGVFIGSTPADKKKKKGKLTPVQAILQVLSSLHGLSVILLSEVTK